MGLLKRYVRALSFIYRSKRIISVQAKGIFFVCKICFSFVILFLLINVRSGQPTVPLVKDTYASERRKAKTLNFSIAYGKVRTYFNFECLSPVIFIFFVVNVVVHFSHHSCIPFFFMLKIVINIYTYVHVYTYAIILFYFILSSRIILWHCELLYCIVSYSTVQSCILFHYVSFYLKNIFLS